VLSARLGYTPEDFSWSISHLEERHIFSRTTDGIIYSRRMIRDAKAAAKKKAAPKRAATKKKGSV
jgi:hypothetical protein